MFHDVTGNEGPIKTKHCVKIILFPPPFILNKGSRSRKMGRHILILQKAARENAENFEILFDETNKKWWCCEQQAKIILAHRVEIIIASAGGESNCSASWNEILCSVVPESILKALRRRFQILKPETSFRSPRIHCAYSRVSKVKLFFPSRHRCRP